MNCKGCKKNICSEYKGHKWFDLLNNVYCERKYFNKKKEQTFKDLAKTLRIKK